MLEGILISDRSLRMACCCDFSGVAFVSCRMLQSPVATVSMSRPALVLGKSAV